MSLDKGYASFKGFTLEPISDKGFTLFKELHDTTHMDPYHDENSALSDHLGELFHSPTSYNSMFCSISLNEVWVKGFFFMVPQRSMELLYLLFMMTLLDQTLIHIYRRILCYFMMMHIYMDAPMICI